MLTNKAGLPAAPTVHRAIVLPSGTTTAQGGRGTVGAIKLLTVIQSRTV